jgi:hypothetical protein
VFLYDPPDMKPWRLVVAIVVIVAVSVYGVRYALEKRTRQKREVAYSAALTSNSELFRPGMTRKVVEDYFRARNIGFRQMCCVDRKEVSKTVYDDLVKIGQEGAPWFCSEKNIYVAFQFTGAERNGPSGSADPSDKLKAVSIYRWLEGCL